MMDGVCWQQVERLPLRQMTLIDLWPSVAGLADASRQLDAGSRDRYVEG
jgi:hypothetical protein